MAATSPALPPWADPKLVREQFAAWLVTRGKGASTAQSYAALAARLLPMAIDPAALTSLLESYKPTTYRFARVVLRSTHKWMADRHSDWQPPSLPKPRRDLPTKTPGNALHRMAQNRKRWSILVAFICRRLRIGADVARLFRLGWIVGTGDHREIIGTSAKRSYAYALEPIDTLAIAALIKLGYSYQTPTDKDPIFAFNGRSVSARTIYAAKVDGVNACPYKDLPRGVREVLESCMFQYRESFDVLDRMDPTTLIVRSSRERAPLPPAVIPGVSPITAEDVAGKPPPPPPMPADIGVGWPLDFEGQDPWASSFAPKRPAVAPVEDKPARKPRRSAKAGAGEPSSEIRTDLPVLSDDQIDQLAKRPAWTPPEPAPAADSTARLLASWGMDADPTQIGGPVKWVTPTRPPAQTTPEEKEDADVPTL